MRFQRLRQVFCHHNWRISKMSFRTLVIYVDYVCKKCGEVDEDFCTREELPAETRIVGRDQLSTASEGNR